MPSQSRILERLRTQAFENPMTAADDAGAQANFIMIGPTVSLGITVNK